jgi:hypothetical protein
MPGNVVGLGFSRKVETGSQREIKSKAYPHEKQTFVSIAWSMEFFFPGQKTSWW